MLFYQMLAIAFFAAFTLFVIYTNYKHSKIIKTRKEAEAFDEHVEEALNLFN